MAILGNVADGIVAVDREGRVVLWNAAAEEITGVAAARGDRAGRRRTSFSAASSPTRPRTTAAAA